MKNKQTFFLIILLFSFFLSCNENDSELFIDDLLDSSQVQNRSLDCECEATITNINDDFKIITELYYFAETCSGMPPLPSDPFNCNGCNIITNALLAPGESESNTLNVSNMFGNDMNYFVIFVQSLAEESCPEVNVVIDCGGNKIISQEYTIPSSFLQFGVERYVKIATFVNEQTDPDWDGTPWTGTWEESCSLTPTLQYWNFPCKRIDEEFVTPCWPTIEN